MSLTPNFNTSSQLNPRISFTHGMPAEKGEYVQIRISEDRKQRWKDEIDDGPEWRSMTHLVVTSVEHELAEEAYGGSADVDLAPIHDRLDGLNDILYDIEDRADETYYHLLDDEAGFVDLVPLILDRLPEGDREEILERDPSQYDDPERCFQRTGSVRHLAQYLVAEEGARSSDVKSAVDHLAETAEWVEATWAEPKKEADKRVYRVEY